MFRQCRLIKILFCLRVSLVHAAALRPLILAGGWRCLRPRHSAFPGIPAASVLVRGRGGMARGESSWFFGWLLLNGWACGMRLIWSSGTETCSEDEPDQSKLPSQAGWLQCLNPGIGSGKRRVYSAAPPCNWLSFCRRAAEKHIHRNWKFSTARAWNYSLYSTTWLSVSSQPERDSLTTTTRCGTTERHNLAAATIGVM